MALSNDDMVIAASVIPSAGGVGTVAAGTLTAKVMFGHFTGGIVTWNNGQEVILSGAAQTGLRQVRPGTNGTNVGLTAQWTSRGAIFRGTIIASIAVELGTVGGTGARTECYLLENGEGLQFIVPVTSATVLD